MTIQDQPYTRQRQFDNYLATLSSNIFTQNISGPTPSSYTSSSYYSSSTYERRVGEMYDVVTDDWFTKLKKGVIVNNPMEQWEDVFTPTTHELTYYRIGRSGTPYTYTGCRKTGPMLIGGFYSAPWALPADPSIDDSVIAQAITEAWSKVSLKEVDLQVIIGEMEKTALSLISIIKRVIKILLALKKLDLKVLVGELSPKELAQRYLEARYALRPLVYDAKGIIKAVNTDMVAFASRKTFRSFKTRMTSNQFSNVLLNTNTGNYWKLYGSQIASRELEVRAGVLTSIETLQGLATWGILEPFETAWELFPFSFIVDWFFNVSKWIGSWSPNIGLKTLASWYVVTDTTSLASTVETGEIYDTLNYLNSVITGGTYSLVKIRKYRLPNPDRPSLPTFLMRMDWWKTLDLGLIVKQLLRLKS
jgi:hypothetical protein